MLSPTDEEISIALERTGMCRQCYDRMVAYTRLQPKADQMRIIKTFCAQAFVLGHEGFHPVMEARAREAGLP
jgi:hypothetical protein